MNTSLPEIQKRYNIIHELSVLGPDDSDAVAISNWYHLGNHQAVGTRVGRMSEYPCPEASACPLRR